MKALIHSHTPDNWQQQLKAARLSYTELLALLALEEKQLNQDVLKALQQFPLRVPGAYLNRIQKGNPQDPLLLQVLPQAAEMQVHPDFSTDPLAESQANPIPGLLHKYHNRVLLTISSACAIHCRYCFRRHFPYNDNNPGSNGWQQAIDYIAARAHIDEVIFSGGDPLTAPDKLLATLSDKLAGIPTLKRLRIHTRLPVVLPERVCSELLAWMNRCPLALVMVIHCNHPQEIDENLKRALAKLKQAGVLLLNQSVLLKNVNDDAAILHELSLRLFDAGVLPYYLHRLDKVSASAHFDLPKQRAQAIYQDLQAMSSGYLLPKFVEEIAGFPAKKII